LYDEKPLLQVTVNGQFYLLMLIERLQKIGVRVISANTDGVTVIVKDSQKERYFEICKEWEKELNFSLEFVEYSLGKPEFDVRECILRGST
jgi:DNA polymerase elongation subunit (family B)